MKRKPAKTLALCLAVAAVSLAPLAAGARSSDRNQPMNVASKKYDYTETASEIAALKGIGRGQLAVEPCHTELAVRDPPAW